MVAAGCVAPPKPIVNKNKNQKIFFYPYESVWRAAQISLKYPVAINNMDNGTLETEWIKQIDGYQPPIQTGPVSSGIRYKVSIFVVKGQVDGQDSVKVTILKKSERLRDFFSEPEVLESDVLEEQMILYRIERELLIDEAIKKAAAT